MLPSTIEPKQLKSVDVVKQLIDSCRLSQLNFDCLGQIFEHLSTGELINMCKIDEIVCSAVKERAVSKRLIDFNEWKQIWSTETIFEKIGEQIKVMSIGESSMCQKMCNGLTPFNQFLSLMTKFCTENRIESLSMYFDIFDTDHNLLEAARPFLANLRQVLFTSVGRRPNDGHEDFFATLIDSAEKLSTIQLLNTCVEGNWLQHKNMKNIENMALIDSNIFKNINWQSYFEQQPSLKFFAWINKQLPNYTLCESIARNCTQLERFIDHQDRVHVKYLQRDFVMNRYNYFGVFKNLKCARITSYTSSGFDLTQVFMVLPLRNTVETLGINFISNTLDQRNPVDRLILTGLRYNTFTSLKSLEIHNHSPCYFWNENIVKFMSCSVNLREVFISASSQLNSIHITNIALATSSLNTLKVYQANINGKELSMALNTISEVKKMDKDRVNEVFSVILNTHQIKELDGQNFGDNIRIVDVRQC